MMHSLIVFSLITISCHGLNVRIAGRSKDCFTKKGRLGDTMHLDYELIDGSYDEVEVTVTDLDRNTVLYASMAPSARRDWTLESDGGEEEERNFQVCFDNTVYMQRKLVSFSWHLNQDELLKYAKADQIENSLKKKVDTLWEEIDTVKDMVHYFGLVQSQQHQTNQNTNSRVAWSSSLELVSIVIMTVMQVYVLKSFFERRQRV